MRTKPSSKAARELARRGFHERLREASQYTGAINLLASPPSAHRSGIKRV